MVSKDRMIRERAYYKRHKMPLEARGVDVEIHCMESTC